jgi:UDP:flavonoid glycosyltransferase YjiC (YdhE family)
LRIVVAALGSRGDVQPFLNLGVGLRENGHDVQMAVPENFMELVKEHGLGFVSIRGDFKKMLSSTEGRKFLKSKNPITFVSRIKKLSNELMQTMQDDIYDALDGADACVFSYLCGPVIDVAEKTRIPCFLGMVYPVLRTGEYPNLAVTLKNLGSHFNKWTYDLFTFFMWIAFGSICNNWRKTRLGLSKSPIFQRIEKSGIPILAAYSSYVVPKPTDWPVQAYVTGYWFPNVRDDWQATGELENFLASGPPPVCVTFGSMTDNEIDQITKLIKHTLKNERLRGIFVASWSGMGKAEAESNDFYYLESIPYNWLFPKVAAVLQHGGAGTLAATLEAGIPPIVLPFVGDQKFWAQQVYKLGVAPKPFRRSALNEKRLSSALRIAINDKSLRKKAYELGCSIRGENGVAAAIDIIHQYLGIKT